ncbi:MAG TPA: hypothetical protein DCZ63_06090 [Geobacter sp.]|nr:hypothetical protein [Geobacter sp.]
MEYVEAFSSESFGSNNSLGIKILVGSNQTLPNLRLPDIFDATHRAASLIESEIRFEMKKLDPNAAKETERNSQLLSCFDSPIYVEERPNGYCKDWCCRHLPWFVVTTKIGRFTIGWRKRVINIDWSDTTCKLAGSEIFAGEDTTIGFRFIHAWGLDKATEYVSKIIAAPDRH